MMIDREYDPESIIIIPCEIDEKDRKKLDFDHYHILDGKPNSYLSPEYLKKIKKAIKEIK